ncbi:MAG TPA: M20/M25/M40 family metallo-hydrolase [Gemmatimonadaceae bacterium]|nr:M20/M25/M40 family metallo-hydrolase [Gemmatimonadaceae bacterium]
MRSLLLLGVVLSIPGVSFPQPARIVSGPAIDAAIAKVRADNEWTLTQQVSICEIPAPPFKEQVRGQELKKRFESLGLRNVRVDREGNVIGERPGTGNGPVVLLSAHLDTVFPESTNVKVTRTGTMFKGPGIGDDCRGLAVMLATIRAMNAANVRTPGTILFVGTVGEEGPGNLRGVRHMFTKESPAPKIDYFLSIDGTGLGTTNRAVGSHRYYVTYTGPGGHSFGAFGMPNPIHALGRAIALIGEIKVPATPKTTFNVGIVSGGTSVNTISPLGAMDVDLRSESPVELARVDSLFRQALQQALDAEHARWPNSRTKIKLDIVDRGVRPAGGVADSAHIVRVAQAAAQRLGFETELGSGSTDSNIPMSLGIPSITIDGGGRGQGAHSTGESYDDTDRGWLAPQWTILIITSLAGAR